MQAEQNASNVFKDLVGICRYGTLKAMHVANWSLGSKWLLKRLACAIWILYYVGVLFEGKLHKSKLEQKPESEEKEKEEEDAAKEDTEVKAEETEEKAVNKSYDLANCVPGSALVSY